MRAGAPALRSRSCAGRGRPLPRVGLLVSNAAHSPIGSYSENDLAGTLRAIDVNVRGPVAHIHTLAKGMTARGRGGIVLMSSFAGLQGSPRLAAYAATKALNLVSAEKRMGRIAPPRRGRRRVLHWRGAHVWVCEGPGPAGAGHNRRPHRGRDGPQRPGPGATRRAGTSEQGDGVLHDEASQSAPRGASHGVLRRQPRLRQSSAGRTDAAQETTGSAAGSPGGGGEGLTAQPARALGRSVVCPPLLAPRRKWTTMTS